MSFIDVDYFKGSLQIPNLDKDTAAFESNYIEVFEKEYLIHVLGYDLYAQLIANYNTLTDDKWKWLVEGKTFVVTLSAIDYTVNWNGLINTAKLSPIAYYVYYKYVEQNYQQLTGLGVGAQNNENATTVDPSNKMVWSNNECRKLTGFYQYETTGLDLTYDSLEATLFNFIINNITDYTNWVYQPINEMNILGI